jgi:hypothetical protein
MSPWGCLLKLLVLRFLSQSLHFTPNISAKSLFFDALVIAFVHKSAYRAGDKTRGIFYVLL